MKEVKILSSKERSRKIATYREVCGGGSGCKVQPRNTNGDRDMKTRR